MVFTSDGGGSSDRFLVSPQTLRSGAPTYSNAALDVHNLQSSLLSAVQLASGDMFLILEFAKLASTLEQLQARIAAAMECASTGLSRMSIALEIAAEEYEGSDLEVSTAFTVIEDDTKQWKPFVTPTIPIITPWQQSSGTQSLDPKRPTPQPEPATKPSVDWPIIPNLLP